MELRFSLDIIGCKSMEDIKVEMFPALEQYRSLFPSSQDAKILLKPNLNSNMNALTGNTTDLRLLSALIQFLKEKGFSNRAELLQEMEEAVRIIETIPNFDMLIPQVRANLASCEHFPKSIRDVISIPGRITLLKNRAHAVGAPEFGSSEHTAEILLWGNEVREEIRSCLCLSGKSAVREIAETAGFDIIEVETPARSAKEIIEHSQPLVETSGFDSDYPAIYVPGGLGVEPILYLFGPGPIPLANKCSEMADSL